jgi:hypothetical protein
MSVTTASTILASLVAMTLLTACMPRPPANQGPIQSDAVAAPEAPPSPAEVNCIAAAVQREGVDGIRATRIEPIGSSGSPDLRNGFEVFLRVPGITNQQVCLTDSNGNVVGTIL